MTIPIFTIICQTKNFTYAECLDILLSTFVKCMTNEHKTIRCLNAFMSELNRPKYPFKPMNLLNLTNLFEFGLAYSRSKTQP